MIDASLDSSGVREMLSAIARKADYLDVTVHAKAGGRAAAYRASIEDAMKALLGGAAVAVRLSYRVDRTIWSDTLIRGSSGFRMLRVSSARGSLYGGD
jgi:hypothetical protein